MSMADYAQGKSLAGGLIFVDQKLKSSYVGDN